MEDDYLSRRRAASSGISLRAVLGTSLLAFIGGAALIGWLAWDGKLSFVPDFAKPAATAPVAAPSPLAGVLPTPVPSPSPALEAVTGGMDQRIAALEQRLARIDLQAAASEGNTARAEALLVALAARRAIERGAPLGYLEDQLKLRFGDAQGNAVTTVIDAARIPVTLDQLAGGLDAMAPALLGTPPKEGSWDRFRRELSGLFVIRRGDAPSARPADRLDRARLMLRSGQIEAAMDEVQRLPGAALANDWSAAARRYAAAQKALDLIETAALLEPEKLKDADGGRVRQPGPGTPPVDAIQPADSVPGGAI
jgi:hypothetical protein